MGGFVGHPRRRIINDIVGFLKEAKAEKAIEALAKMVATETTVRRDGRKLRVHSEELLPGDVVLLQSGYRVPADLRLFHVRNLHADESALTGESLPVAKHALRASAGYDSRRANKSRLHRHAHHQRPGRRRRVGHRRPDGDGPHLPSHFQRSRVVHAPDEKDRAVQQAGVLGHYRSRCGHVRTRGGSW